MRSLPPSLRSESVGRSFFFLRPSRKQFSCPVIPPPPLFLPSTSTSLPRRKEPQCLLSVFLVWLRTTSEERLAWEGGPQTLLSFFCFFFFLPPTPFSLTRRHTDFPAPSSRPLRLPSGTFFLPRCSPAESATQFSLTPLRLSWAAAPRDRGHLRPSYEYNNSGRLYFRPFV